MILVVGATGLAGSDVCQRLAKKGKAVRALVRTTSDPAKVAALKTAGVELAYGDLKDPASLRSACAGVDAIVSTASSTFSRAEGDSIETVDGAGQLALVDAAKAAGVDRFVFVSFAKPQGMSIPLADAKAAVEAAIADLNYTVIEASWFMEIWLSPYLGFDYANAKARVYGPGTNTITWVSSGDVAEMCVRALENSAADRKTFHFGGPEPMSPLAVIELFERIGGKKFEVEHIPMEALMQQFAAATGSMEKSFAALGLGYAQGDHIDMKDTQQQFGLELKTVESYTRQVLGK